MTFISATTDSTQTDKRTNIPTDSGLFGLKIYFTDEGNDDTRLTAGTDNNRDQQIQDNNKLQNFLLTSTEEKQVNSRHELYKNPKKPEIKFRTESPSSLRTVASPLLVQNSVKNKFVENAKRRLRKKRGEKDKRATTKKSKDKTATKSNNWPKAFSVNGASWFKRYQALYNDLLKRNGQKAMPTLKNHRTGNYYYNNQFQPPAQRNAILDTEYYLKYIYPLYFLHLRDNHEQVDSKNYVGWNKNQHNEELRSRNVVPGTHPPENSLQARKFSSQYRSTIDAWPSSASRGPIGGQNQVVMSRHLLQEPDRYPFNNNQNIKSDFHRTTWPYTMREASFFNYQQRPNQYQSIPSRITLGTPPGPKEHNIQSIGLKDDASFMEASPNYDRSALTLHAMQSLIPKAQIKSIVPKIQRTPMITAKGSSMKAQWMTVSDSGKRNFPAPLHVQVSNNGRGKTIVEPNKTKVNSGKALKAVKSYMQRSEIARPKTNTATGERNGITLRFYKEADKPKIDFPPENEDVKRDVVYKSVNPLSDIDADDVTAENLAAIFSELDGQIDEALQDKVAKKDTVARPQKDDAPKSQGEIEMTVYDTSKEAPIKKAGVQFVNVTKDNGGETNFQQSLDMQDIEKDVAVGSLKEAIIKPGFDLKRLHFGIRNGNTFD